jgi:hypothetical protein
MTGCHAYQDFKVEPIYVAMMMNAVRKRDTTLQAGAAALAA